MKDHRLIETTEAFREEQGVTRRQALGKTAKLGLGLTLACAPAAATMLARRVYAQEAPPTPLEILNYALTLEYLEDSYYRQGVAAAGLIPDGAARDAYTLISQHETAHVAFLTAVIEGLEGEPVEFEDTAFDFTAGGTFDPFNDYPTFLTLSQAFEDTGVRAYKGQAAFIPRDAEFNGTNILTAALQIHSLEARHAAEVRRLRAMMGESVQPWIVLADGTAGTAVEAIYAGEDNVMQAGIDTTMLGDGFSAEDASAAYDEPLTMAQVLAIADPFLAS
ncbi:MAG: ferritin-like domain-containing protein [Rhodothermales bacterium]